MLNKAIALAKKAHEGQVDKGGNPYIDHPLRVMNAVETEEEKIVGILHDAVEDSELTLSDLRVAGLSDRIIEAVDAITKREGEKRKDYLKRVMNNPIALKVKIAEQKAKLSGAASAALRVCAALIMRIYRESLIPPIKIERELGYTKKLFSNYRRD